MDRLTLGNLIFGGRSGDNGECIKVKRGSIHASNGYSMRARFLICAASHVQSIMGPPGLRRVIGRQSRCRTAAVTRAQSIR